MENLLQTEQIDTEKFRALCVTDGLVFCSSAEEQDSTFRIFHPYFVAFATEEDDDSMDFARMDPWNPADFLDISKSKVEFMTNINPFYTQVFRKVMFSRLGTKAPEDSLKDSSSKVVLINRKTMN